MVVAETTAAIRLGDATVTDATETGAIIDALASQYNTTSIKAAGAKVPRTLPPSSILPPHQSYRTTTTHHHPLFYLTLLSFPR